MPLKDQAIAAAQRTKERLDGIEADLEWAIQEATDRGLPNVLDKLIFARGKVRKAHNAMNRVAHALAPALGGGVTTYSGGDDKPDDEPPPPPPPPPGP